MKHIIQNHSPPGARDHRCNSLGASGGVQGGSGRGFSAQYSLYPGRRFRLRRPLLLRPSGLQNAEHRPPGQRRYEVSAGLRQFRRVHRKPRRAHHRPLSIPLARRISRSPSPDAMWACRPDIPRFRRCSKKPVTGPRCWANGTSAPFPISGRSRAATIISGDSAAAVWITSRTNPAARNPTPTTCGTDDVKIHENGYLTDLLAEQAIKSINGYVKERKPFFISLHFNAPHWPWEGPDDEAIAQTLTSLGSFDAGTIKTYGRMVVEMDLQVGRILKALDGAGAARNTIVVFTSDNGGERFSDTWPFNGKKTELLEGGLRIPAIVRWPGHIKPKSTTEQVSMTMDWLPTLVAAAGTQPDPAYPSDGINLLPCLTQDAAAGSAPGLLALSPERAASRSRRRHEVSEDQRQHISV